MIHRTADRVIRVLILTCLALGIALAAIAQEPLKLGVHPYLSASEVVKRYTPLAEYLAREIKHPVSVEVSSTYGNHIQKIGQGALDIAFMGPGSYVILTSQYGKRPILAAFRTKEGKVFHGHIMVRKDSPITTLGQLKGKRFVFGDRDSTMSHVVPRHLLLKNGVDVKQLGSVSFVANHDNIALGILAGTFDAGAVKEEVFLNYQSQGLRSLARTQPIMDHIFIARTGLPKDLVQALGKALIHITDTAEGKKILFDIRSDVVSLVPGDDRDFDNLRAIVSDLEKAGVDL
ncbi:MAG: phosphate/phosphite/phosphonate ABC transporter substrate-binding protein [Nitrospirota bacterium]|nr:phosphate/phosphite/phosphonate ABC transporter substrate-binding protein [Nitrospirota bacterium]